MSVTPPLASVVIPTYNRKDNLRETLRALLAQSVADRLEILVMDDRSPDTTGEMMAAEFPEIRYHRSETNVGPTVQRNRGARLAGGEFLFTVDDDCVLVHPKTVEQTIALFDRPRIGAVTIPFQNVLKPDKSVRYAAPDGEQCYVSSMFYGGMVAFRRSAYLAVGGYREFYFMHVEEPDLAIRLMNAGFVVRLGTADPIHHMESPQRNYNRLHGLGPRNHMLYSWYNVPVPDIAWHLPATAAQTFLFSLKHGFPGIGGRSLCRGAVDCLREWNARRPVKRSVYKLSREIRSAPGPLSQIEPLLPPIQAAS